MKNIKKALTLALACSAISSSWAIDVMPSFSDVTIPTWVTDRYEPEAFETIPSYEGRSNVLGITVDSTDGQNPAPQDGLFYSTKGRKKAISGGVGDSLEADLFVENTWSSEANGSIRTDMWATMSDALGDITAYAIIGFTNYNGLGRFRVYDAEAPGFWVDLLSPVLYDAWNSLSIELTNTSFDYYVNGTLAYSDSTINGSTNFKEVIMQSYDFAHPEIAPAAANKIEYTAHWSNAQVPDTGSTVMLLFAGLVGIIGLRRNARR